VEKEEEEEEAEEEKADEDGEIEEECRTVAAEVTGKPLAGNCRAAIVCACQLIVKADDPTDSYKLLL
jgi:hypothetical protein